MEKIHPGSGTDNKTLEVAMKTTLQSLGLTEEQASRLVEHLGIEHEEDLLLIVDTDFIRVGLKPIPARRLVQTIKRVHLSHEARCELFAFFTSDAFTREEFYRFILWGPEGGDRMPEHPVRTTEELLRKLLNEGGINHLFFDRLEDERPKRKQWIRRIRRLCLGF